MRPLLAGIGAVCVIAGCWSYTQESDRNTETPLAPAVQSALPTSRDLNTLEPLARRDAKPHKLFGDVWSIVSIPAIGVRAPVSAGTSDADLAAGVGHWTNGISPGGVGNYVLAGHRVTHTEPFARFEELRAGDKVYVRTTLATYVYVLDTSGTDLRVDKSELWVVRRNPAHLKFSRRLVLITCSETYHTDSRSVVFGHLSRTIRP